MSFKKTNLMKVCVSFKLIFQCLSLVNTRMKFKAHYGRERVSCCLPLQVFTKEIVKHTLYALMRILKTKLQFLFFLNNLFNLIHTENEDLPSAEIIWSDGPASEFKNRYMVKLISMLSEKYTKPFF